MLGKTEAVSPAADPTLVISRSPDFATGLRHGRAPGVVMQRVNVDQLRQAIEAVRAAMQRAEFDTCDSADLDEIIEPVERELNAANPNPSTLSTYLNSLARSLRAEPSARNAVMKLDAAMRESGIPAQWEH